MVVCDGVVFDVVYVVFVFVFGLGMVWCVCFGCYVLVVIEGVEVVVEGDFVGLCVVFVDECLGVVD